VPADFHNTVVTSALNAPTSMAFAPNGRLFVTEQGGALRVITRTGHLLLRPFSP